MDTQSKEVFYDKLTFVYLEMPKFNKTEDQLETLFDKWLFVLRNLTRMFDRPAALQERVFNRLFEAAEISKFTQQQLVEYEDSLKVYRDWKNTIETAKIKSHAKGREEGVAIGLKKGEAIGLEKARAEFKLEQKNMIVQMVKKGCSVHQISNLTGLSFKEVSSLIKE